MQEITVTIKWNEPDEPFWLNADNIKMALSTYCQNTTFEVEASRDSRILSAVPSGKESNNILSKYAGSDFSIRTRQHIKEGWRHCFKWMEKELTKRGIAG